MAESKAVLAAFISDISFSFPVFLLRYIGLIGKILIKEEGKINNSFG